MDLHASCKQKSDGSKESFYDELGQVFVHFPKYHMKILLRDFSAKMGERTFSNQQLRMRVYIRIVMIIMLEY